MINEVLSPMDESSKTVDRGALHDYTLALLERIQGEIAKRSVTGEFVSLGTFGDMALLVAEYRDSDVDSPLDRLIDESACDVDLEIEAPDSGCLSLTICDGGGIETFTVSPGGLVFGDTTDMSFGAAKHTKDQDPVRDSLTFHTAWGLAAAANRSDYVKAQWVAFPESRRDVLRSLAEWVDVVTSQAKYAAHLANPKPVELRVCWSDPVDSKAIDDLVKRLRDECPSIKSVEMQRVEGAGQFAASEKLCLWPYGVSDDRTSVVLVTVSRRGSESSTMDVSALITGINSGEFA
jgi:hypothetical protein